MADLVARGDLDIGKRRLLRRLTALVYLLGLPLLVLGALPGTAVYEDANDCFGHALAGIFGHGGGARDCTPSYVLDRTEAVIHHPIAWISLLAALLPGLVVWFRPRLRYALAWSACTVAFTALAAVATFDLRLFDHTVTLWPAQVAGVLTAGMLLALVVALPLASAVFAWTHRRRPPPPVELPPARVV